MVACHLQGVSEYGVPFFPAVLQQTRNLGSDKKNLKQLKMNRHETENFSSMCSSSLGSLVR